MESAVDIGVVYDNVILSGLNQGYFRAWSCARCVGLEIDFGVWLSPTLNHLHSS